MITTLTYSASCDGCKGVNTFCQLFNDTLGNAMMCHCKQRGKVHAALLWLPGGLANTVYLLTRHTDTINSSMIDNLGKSVPSTHLGTGPVSQYTNEARGT